MDAINLYGLVFSVVVAVLSAGASFFNKQRLQGQIDLLQAGNDELRKQINDLRLERTDLAAELAAAKARSDEREKVLQDYKDQNFGAPIAQLTATTANNHKEIMTMLSRLIPNGN